MSFDGSIGDILATGAPALKAYRTCKEAAGEFAELTREVSAVSILIQDLEEQAASPSFARNQQDSRNQAKLRSLIDSIAYRLRDLKQLATKLADRSVARIECKSDETNDALSRVEKVLADIVKDLKHGGCEPSVVSDERWNIWTELKRELRIEGYPIEVVQQHKSQIKQYLFDLLREAGLQDDMLTDEPDPQEDDERISRENYVSASTGESRPLITGSNNDSRRVFHCAPLVIQILCTVIAGVTLMVMTLEYSQVGDSAWVISKTLIWANPNAPMWKETRTSRPSQAIHKLRAGLVSPDEDATTIRQGCISTRSTPPPKASYCPRVPAQLYGSYWDIYSPEPPWRVQEEAFCMA